MKYAAVAENAELFSVCATVLKEVAEFKKSTLA
jgi:hypothetical protein